MGAMLSRPPAIGILIQDIVGRESMSFGGTRFFCNGPIAPQARLQCTTGTGRGGDPAFAAHPSWMTNQTAKARHPAPTSGAP